MFKSLFQTAKKLIKAAVSKVKELFTGLTTHKEMTEEQVVEVKEKRATTTKIVLAASAFIATTILFPVAACLLIGAIEVIVLFAIADGINDIANHISAMKFTAKSKA